MKSGLLASILVGGAVVEILVSWLAPRSIVWYFQPPVQTEFSCTEPIGWALARMQTVQLIGLVFGALLGVIVYYLMRRRSAQSAPVR
jgi:hypothetical protein